MSTIVTDINDISSFLTVEDKFSIPVRNRVHNESMNQSNFFKCPWLQSNLKASEDSNQISGYETMSQFSF